MVKKKLQVFSHPFDPWDAEDRIQLKKAYAISTKVGKPTFPTFSDPCEGIMPNLDKTFFDFIGKIKVESWVSPTPDFEDLSLLTKDNFCIFIDSDGCREYSESVKDFLKKVDGIPVMIGIDHSATGGAFKAMVDKFGKDRVSLIVLDSHSDFIPMRNRYDMIRFDLEKSNCLGDDSISITERPESYNAGTFIYYLIKEKVISPEHVLVAGVSDRPEDSLQYGDNRVDLAIKHYRNLEDKGLSVITKKEVHELSTEELFKKIKRSINTHYAYISIDIDVGAIASIMGARQLFNPPIIGLEKKDIYKILEVLNKFLEEVNFVGLDMMEIDVYKAGMVLSDGSIDITFQLGAHILNSIIK